MLSRISNPGLYSDSRLERFCWPDSIDLLNLCGSWQMKPSSTLRLKLPPVFIQVFQYEFFRSDVTTSFKKHSWQSFGSVSISESWCGVRCDSPDRVLPLPFASPPSLLNLSPAWSHLTFNELYNQSKAAINSIQRKREKMIGTLWDTDRHSIGNSSGTSGSCTTNQPSLLLVKHEMHENKISKVPLNFHFSYVSYIYSIWCV